MHPKTPISSMATTLKVKMSAWLIVAAEGEETQVEDEDADRQEERDDGDVERDEYKGARSHDEAIQARLKEGVTGGVDHLEEDIN